MVTLGRACSVCGTVMYPKLLLVPSMQLTVANDVLTASEMHVYLRKNNDSDEPVSIKDTKAVQADAVSLNTWPFSLWHRNPRGQQPAKVSLGSIKYWTCQPWAPPAVALQAS